MKVGDKILITEAGMEHWFDGIEEKPAYGLLISVERYKHCNEYDEDDEEVWVEENYFDLYNLSGKIIYRYWYLGEDEFILMSKKEPEEWM